METGNRKWKIGAGEIKEVNEYVYLGVTVQGGLYRGVKSMRDRMKESNKVIGMISMLQVDQDQDM